MIDINKNIIEDNTDSKDNKVIKENEENEIIEEQTNNDIEVLNAIPNLNNSILAGGVDIIYNIDYILPEDEKLINIEKIIKQVDKYIENYNNPQTIKYNKDFKQLLQKYSNKKYIIKTIKNKNDSIKLIVIKNDDKYNNIDDNKKSIIKEITKPIYIYYNEDNNLYKLKNKISNYRTELQYKYEVLTAKLNITIDDKKNFEKDRNNFIELLEEYYIYTLYHKKINNIITINKTNLLIQEIAGFYKENIEITNPILNSNLYYIDNLSIEIINKFNIDKLTQFNDLMLQLSGKNSDNIKKDKKLIDEIKKYLDRKEFNIINDNITKAIIPQNVDSLINYIILTLPIV